MSGRERAGAGLRRVADSVVSPVERAAAAVVRPIRTEFGSIGDAKAEKRQADSLAGEIAGLRRQLAADAEAQRQAAALTKLGLLASAGSFKLVAVRA